MLHPRSRRAPDRGRAEQGLTRWHPECILARLSDAAVTTFTHHELTIDHGATFLVTARNGQLTKGREGLYHRDVRYLSRYHFTLNGTEPTLLTGMTTEFQRSCSFFTNARVGGYRTEVRQGLLILTLIRTIHDELLVEEWEVNNYSLLGLECDPVARRLTVVPAVPERLGEIELLDMEVLGGWLSIRAKGTAYVPAI